MKISIIMPAFMAASTISQAIESVLNQTHTDFELLIVNDGSIDSTESLIVPFLKSDKRIRYFSQTNMGVSAARNVALENLNGDAVSYLDADDIYMPNHIEVRVRLLKLGHVFVFGPVWEVKNNVRSVFHGSLKGDQNDCVLPLMVLHTRDCIEEERFDPAIVFEEDLDLWRRIITRRPFHQFAGPPTAEYHVHSRSAHIMHKRGGDAAIHLYRQANDMGRR